MKPTLLALIFTLSFTATYSQDYMGLPESGGKWVNSFYSLEWQGQNPIPDYVLIGTVSYCTAGVDTVINAEHYTVIDTCMSSGYKGAFRNYEEKVFYVPKDSINEYLLYDYSLMPGDTAYDVYYEDQFGNPFIEEYVVCSNVDSVQINGAYRKVIHHQMLSIWIEGIGQDRGLFLEPWQNISNYSVELHCMSRNDTVLFPEFFDGPCNLILSTDYAAENRIKLNLYPNPARGHFRIEMPDGTERLQTVELHDIQGRLVRTWPAAQSPYPTAGLPAGMYVVRAGGPEGVFTQKLVIE